jgi:hypothetical protein
VGARGLVPPGMVERAIEAAWPGTHTRTTPAKPPIRTEHPADPIRAMLGAPVGLGPHGQACVQILAPCRRPPSDPSPPRRPAGAYRSGLTR